MHEKGAARPATVAIAPKMIGVKVFGGQIVPAGSIIVRHGHQVHAVQCRRRRDHPLFAMVDGEVSYAIKGPRAPSRPCAVRVATLLRAAQQAPRSGLVCFLSGGYREALNYHGAVHEFVDEHPSTSSAGDGGTVHELPAREVSVRGERMAAMGGGGSVCRRGRNLNTLIAIATRAARRRGAAKR